MVLYIFRAREDDLDRSKPCKKLSVFVWLTVCHSVLEQNLVNLKNYSRFSQNLVSCVFWAREDDLDSSQLCKKNWIVCLSFREHNSRKSRETFKRFFTIILLPIFPAREDDLDTKHLIKFSLLFIFNLNVMFENLQP